jgi:NAD(P)-dependent dehydrogenase (short-subunit alcohol dehydrogenase family)
MKHVIVTGAGRGIGLELTRQLLARGDRVTATARDPNAPSLAELKRQHGDHLRVLALDVSDAASIEAFARQIDGEPVDVLINNAAISGNRGALNSLEMADALKVYATNAVGPVLLTRALRGNLRKGTDARVAHITSAMGSISENTSGGWYAYRMSKAALNMASKCLALEFEREGILSAVINPGWVKTDMGGSGAPTEVNESAEGILRVIDSLTAPRSGAFLDYRGEREIGW